MPGAHRIWCLATDDMVIVPHVKPYSVHAMLLPGTVGGTGVHGLVRGANGTLAGSKSDASGGATVPTRESRDNADLGATAHRGQRGPSQDGAGTTRIYNGVPLDIARPIRGLSKNRLISLSVGEGEGWCFVIGLCMLMSAGVLETCRLSMYGHQSVCLRSVLPYQSM